MGTKNNHQKTTKNSFFSKTITQEVEKSWSFYKNCVLEDVLIYHLRLKENFFFEEKFQKILSVNFVGPDPRLLEIGAKWRTHWALKLKIKKIKGFRGLAQEAQPSDLYPYARKSDTWVQKKIIKKQLKTVFFKTITQEVEKSWSY